MSETESTEHATGARASGVRARASAVTTSKVSLPTARSPSRAAEAVLGRGDCHVCTHCGGVCYGGGALAAAASAAATTPPALAGQKRARQLQQLAAADSVEAEGASGGGGEGSGGAHRLASEDSAAAGRGVLLSTPPDLRVRVRRGGDVLRGDALSTPLQAVDTNTRIRGAWRGAAGVGGGSGEFVALTMRTKQRLLSSSDDSEAEEDEEGRVSVHKHEEEATVDNSVDVDATGNRRSPMRLYLDPAWLLPDEDEPPAGDKTVLGDDDEEWPTAPFRSPTPPSMEVPLTPPNGSPRMPPRLTCKVDIARHEEEQRARRRADEERRLPSSLACVPVYCPDDESRVALSSPRTLERERVARMRRNRLLGRRRRQFV